jgi:hypothetical protein
MSLITCVRLTRSPALTIKETQENPAHLHENEPVIACQEWVDGRQAARLLGLRAHHRQEAD